MMKIDMHCHTKEGSLDGKVPIRKYISLLKEKGFQGMVVTDHNSYNGYRKWKTKIKGKEHLDFKVFKGVEYDTIDAGHIIVIMPETIKLKILELRGLPVQILIDFVHRYGGILGPAHPCGQKYLSLTNTRGYRKNKHILSKFDFIEEFNACESEESNYEASMLAQTYHLPGTGGSDAHQENCIGLAYTVLQDDIETETQLIKYFKEKNKVTCGGERYLYTTKQKIGKVSRVLEESFWFYNELGSLRRRHKRVRELKMDRMKQRVEEQTEEIFHKVQEMKEEVLEGRK